MLKPGFGIDLKISDQVFNYFVDNINVLLIVEYTVDRLMQSQADRDIQVIPLHANRF